MSSDPSDFVKIPSKSYDELYELLEKQNSYLENPREYVQYFNEVMEQGNIMDIIMKDIIKYANSNKEFKESLLKSLSPPPHETVPKSRSQLISSLQNSSIFSSRVSSRPSLR